MGWKPEGLCWLLRRSAYWVGIRAERVWGQVAPAVDLLHSLDKDALAGRQQAEFVKVEAGEVVQAAFRVGEQPQDTVRRVRSPTGCWTRKVGRVTPCAPVARSHPSSGAHGVARSTHMPK